MQRECSNSTRMCDLMETRNGCSFHPATRCRRKQDNTSTSTLTTAAMKNNNFSNLVLSMGQEANVLIIAEKMVDAATNGELTQLGLVQYAHSLTSLVTTVVDLK